MAEIIKLGKVSFPATTYSNINMMPFIMGDVKSLPDEYRQYWPIIDACGVEAAENGRVGYLTITETEVPKGVSQRRPGVHTDGHCCRRSDKRFLKDDHVAAGTAGWGWGSGKVLGDGTLHVKGIYMASSVEGTTRAWDVRVDNSGFMGDCDSCPDVMETLRGLEPIMLEANRLYWMTDRCPHEALPMPEGGHRQYFRLVTSAVDVWYTRHSTPNRLGVRPPCIMVDGDKFSMATMMGKDEHVR